MGRVGPLGRASGCRISILFVFVAITNVCIGILLFFALLGGLDLDDGELVVRQLRDEDKVVG